eukprot:2957148-Pleurochrysis_carterae.AAC.4
MLIDAYGTLEIRIFAPMTCELRLDLTIKVASARHNGGTPALEVVFKIMYRRLVAGQPGNTGKIRRGVYIKVRPKLSTASRKLSVACHSKSFQVLADCTQNAATSMLRNEFRRLTDRLARNSKGHVKLPWVVAASILLRIWQNIPVRFTGGLWFT